MGKPFDDVPADWARHLKPKGKRTFWRKVRHKVKLELQRTRREAAPRAD